MEEQFHKSLGLVEFKADGPNGPTGEVSAMFSKFGVVDSDGDILVREAFKDGQSVTMVAHHQWDTIIGKGTVQVTDEGAVFNGRFFLETTAGKEWYHTVKAMGDAQEWSFGYRVTEQEIGDAVRTLGAYRIIKGLDLFEVSPVLIGANRETHTLAIKGQSQTLEAHGAAVREAVAAYAERVRQVAELRQGKGGSISPDRVAELKSVVTELSKASDAASSVLQGLQSVDVDPAAVAAAVAAFNHVRLTVGAK